MALDYQHLHYLRRNHPAWRLLVADSAPLIVSFLHRKFILPNLRVLPQAILAEALEDELFSLRQTLGDEAFPRRAQDYLDDWTADDKGWLRKFYPSGLDEPHFDLTPATEKAIAWLASLAERSFVGTESRLLTLFELLKQMAEGSETDIDIRIQELEKRRHDIDRQITQILAGELPLMNDTALKDRFQQFSQMARELLMDFREVEQNFHILDRQVRERIAAWDGNKGQLLEQILLERDSIADSDQGQSFRTFWDFLMSSQKQEELSSLLDRVLSLPPITELKPDQRLRRIHYDWLEAGEHTQRTVALLSQQLRRFLDDKTYLENKRIMEILHKIEAMALDLRDRPPTQFSINIDDTATSVDLPLERPLFRPPIQRVLSLKALEAGDIPVDTSSLYSQIAVDKSRLNRHIRRTLEHQEQTTLCELVMSQPLQQGLAELVTYLQLASDNDKAVFDESISDLIYWKDTSGREKSAAMPRIIWSR